MQGRSPSKEQRSQFRWNLISTLASLSRMMEPAAIELLLQQSLPGASIVVEDLTGGRDHFRVVVKAEQFKGLSRINQHRLIYEALGDAMNGPIHALQIQTEIL